MQEKLEQQGWTRFNPSRASVNLAQLQDSARGFQKGLEKRGDDFRSPRFTYFYREKRPGETPDNHADALVRLVQQYQQKPDNPRVHSVVSDAGSHFLLGLIFHQGQKPRRG